MNNLDNYLEVNDSQNNRLYESLFKQMMSPEMCPKVETQEEIERSKIWAFCLKTRDIETKQKIFVNFCHSSMMKAPTLDLTEEELRALLASEDATSFTIPLLLTKFKSTLDKSGSEALVLDVIINTDFYINKISFSQLYKTFLITVTLETLEKDKYKGFVEKNDWVLLKNKKYQEISGNYSNNINDKIGDKSLVNDLSALLNINDINDSNESSDGFDYEYVKTNINTKLNQNNIDDNNGPKTTSLISQADRRGSETIINERHKVGAIVSVDRLEGQSRALTPKHKLKLDVWNNSLSAQVITPGISDSNQLDLRIGEDRIVLVANNYKLDIFVPILIKSDQVLATFDTFNSLLELKMPLI